MNRVRLLGICTTLLAYGGHFVCAQDAAEDRRFQQLAEEAWQFGLRENPTYATAVGDNRYNDRLPHVRIEDHQRRFDKKNLFRKRWQEIQRDALSAEEQINYDIFGRLLADDLAQYDFREHLIPITNRWGFHVEFPELPKRAPLENANDYENYIARLNAFGRYADEHIELMRAGIEQGYTLPSVVLQGYRETIEPHIVDDPTRSLLYAPFSDFPDRISPTDRELLTAAGRKAIEDSVVPGYRRFLKFMRDQYVPSARGAIGASALPQGRDYYRYCVRRFTTLDLSPEEVHQIGQDEVKRIRGEMEAIIRRVKFDGDRAAFVEHLRSDPRFYAETPEQLMKETALVLKKMDGKLPQLFNKLPRTPYGIREVPPYIAPRTTTAYYSRPSGDGRRAGFYYVNTYNLKSRPLFEIEALSLHEAVPGHHLQIALQQEMTELPNFRRFAGFTAFTEGWGLYSERLGLEVGFYEDPYSDYGRLSYEMWRACRLVVDTGMHYLGWTRQQAIAFMAENTALSMHNIEAEIDRYISWPGQALAYKIGELKICQLRGLAEKALGEKFDIREFHAVVLGSGAVPLDVLEANVKAYIASP
ncbi:MAG: DUF885 domain-containing protein [Pirellulaceae bacterium]